MSKYRLRRTLRSPLSFLLFTALLLTSGAADLHAQTDSLAIPTDSINISAVIDSNAYVSPISEIITYPARDSTVYDIASQTVYMYGAAKVTYESITLEADYIEYDFSRMEVIAYGLLDTAGVVRGRPVFTESGQAFESDTIRYSFETERGLIKQVVTNDGESYVHAEVSKKQDNGEIHNYGGMYTTCSLDNPHYHFRFNKMVVIPDDKIITGPVYMKVRKVPLPLGLPFGFFPNTTKQKAGILIPGYGNNNTLGFFLINGGYYLPINDKMDTKITGDVYSRGSWGLRNVTRYKRRYGYNGNFDLTFNKRLNGDPELANFSKVNSFFVRWNHTQDSKARPGTSFSANVNAGSSNSFRNNYNSSQNDYISNTFASRVNYSKRWTNSQLTLSGSHDQNTSNRSVSITLPQVGYNLNRFFLPLSFLRNSTTGAKKWYETIGVAYSSSFVNRINTFEQDLRLDNLSGLRDDFVNGIQHSVSANTSIKAGYVSINPSFRMNERWHFAREQQFLEDSVLVTDTLNGFYATRDYTMAVNATSKIYGMFNFKGEKLKAIRHVMTPSIGLAYNPEFDYQNQYQSSDGEPTDYNPYTVSAYSQRGFIQRQGAITFGLQNNLEAKVRAKRDSTNRSSTKKLKLIENLSANTSYNLMADSLQIADIRLSARTTIYKGTTLQYSGSFSPYQVNSTGGKIDRFLTEDGDPFLRGLRHNFTLNTSLNGGSGNNNRDQEPEQPSNFASNDELERVEENRDRYVDFTIPWNLTLSYTFGQSNRFTREDGQLNKEATLQQGILFNGDIRVLEKWKLGVSSGYDIDMKEWSSTTLSLYWDLHCWEFNINYIPLGDRKSYNAYIGVKSAILQDLKLQRRGALGEPLFN